MANKASKKDLDKINKKLKKVEKKLDPEIKEELTKEIEIKQEVETTENNDVELSKKKNVTLEPSNEVEDELKNIKESDIKNMKQVRAVTLDHKCPNCASKIEYDIDSSKWKCKYCNSEFTLEEMQTKGYNAASEKNNEDVEDVEDENTFVEYNCPDCGATVVCDKDTVSTFCVYCGNTAILKNRLSGKFRPTYILPFKKKIEDAKKAFAGLSKGRMFCPKDFTSVENIEKIRGLYIPFWLYSYKLTSEIDGVGTTHHSWTSGDTHYTRTNYFKFIRKADVNFDKVPMDGSSHFDDDLMNSIEPFDYSKLEKYNHAYLSGFLAERYDIDSTGMYTKAYERVIKSAEDALLSKCSNYDSRSIRNSNHVINEYTIEYALLPVYMVNVKYQDKYYTFAMNGESGKIIGNIPLNKKKVVIVSIITFIIVFIICALLSYLFYKMGGC
jgi:DNA-directed RNA polymerase subunit RPC12/RpoP